MKKQKKKDELAARTDVRTYVHQLREENAKRHKAMKDIFDKIDRALSRDDKHKKD